MIKSLYACFLTSRSCSVQSSSSNEILIFLIIL
nr:MAG TPA: hypothetical protein [Caudoviricetes sp.]